MAFDTLNEEFEHIASLNKEGKLEPEAAVDYALSHHDSLLRKHFPPQREAAREYYINVTRNLISVHYKVIKSQSNEPIKVWVSPLAEKGQKRGYYPTQEVLEDAERRRKLVLCEINRMLSIWKSYRLPELQDVANTLEALREQYDPPQRKAG